MSPTNNWHKVHPESLKKTNEEVGPWGGWSYLHWEATETNTFNPTLIKQLAKAQNWKFIAQQPISKEAMVKWTWQGRDCFPLGYHGFAPDVNDSTYDRFPRWIFDDATLITLDTGWITALGGVERPANAYVLISNDGKKMSLYHLWGE